MIAQLAYVWIGKNTDSPNHVNHTTELFLFLQLIVVQLEFEVFVFQIDFSFNLLLNFECIHIFTLNLFLFKIIFALKILKLIFYVLHFNSSLFHMC